MSEKVETAALKKRKRDKRDEQRKSRKKLRSKSTGPGDKDVGDGAVANVLDEADISVLDAAAHPMEVDAPEQAAPSSWTVSNPMGGRMLNIDPIFSADEKFLIITYNTSIQIYSTADSLLVRRVPLALSGEGRFDGKKLSIVSTVLSKENSDYVWVACNDGRIWRIDWTNGTGMDQAFTVNTKKLIDVAVELVKINKSPRDVLFVLEKETKTTARIVAYDLAALTEQNGKNVHYCNEEARLLRAGTGGQVLVAATKDNLHVGTLRRKNKVRALHDLEYRFCSFQTSDDIITCLDTQQSSQPRSDKEQQSMDLVVGCARGSILLYRDILAKLPGEESAALKTPVQPQILHWHRRSVHSVKWSEDGNYLVSGGEEAALVLWQLDTGKTNFLPHLSATVENIVISPRGSSYAVHLDDNSTMVLSTAELEPTTYVSGLQSLVFCDKTPQDRIRRVWKGVEAISNPLAAASNPRNPSQLFLCVGNGQQATKGDGWLSTPYVQTFDLASFHSITKHAIARTVPTDHNITDQGHPIFDPRVTHLKFSHGGKWLASVDEWQPPGRDVEPLVDNERALAEACHARKEIYLKFWEVDEGSPASLELVTRVNDAHGTNQPQDILGLASDPTSDRFATMGNDGKVKLWAPRMIIRDGLAVTGPEGKARKSWDCIRTITVAQPSLEESWQSGAIAFSEDGSVMFVAMGGPHHGVVYSINVETGEIHHRIDGLSRGSVRAVEVLSSSLIVLSEDLTVYDMVADELRYGFSLDDALSPAFSMTQLAVNHRSQTFALAVPLTKGKHGALSAGTGTELTVFSSEESKPQFVGEFSQLIVSVLPDLASTGFMVIDSAAQIWSVTEGAEMARVGQPLVDIGLDKETEGKSVGLLNGDAEDDADMASDEEMLAVGEDADMDDDDDGDTHAAVVAPQRLADLFDVAPAFAMPPIEDMFYEVAKLFTATPFSKAGLSGNI